MRKYLMLWMIIGLVFLGYRENRAQTPTNIQTNSLTARSTLATSNSHSSFEEALRGPANAAQQTWFSIYNTHYKSWQDTDEKSRRPIVGGLLGATVGFAAGGLIGYEIEHQNCKDDEFFCGVGGFLLGSSIGTVILVPVGAHLGNGRQGSLSRSMLTTFGVTVVGIGLTALAGEPALLLTIPVVQIFTAVAVERNTSR